VAATAREHREAERGSGGLECEDGDKPHARLQRPVPLQRLDAVRADKPHPARSGSPPGQSGAERGVLGGGGDRVVEKLWKGQEGDAIAAGVGERWGGAGGSASGEKARRSGSCQGAW